MNEAVLVLMMFLTNPTTGDPMELRVVTQSFDTMEECNYVGRNFREFYRQRTGKTISPQIKTVSTCVHYTDFRKPV